jgi:hypothetical protein
MANGRFTTTPHAPARGGIQDRLKPGVLPVVRQLHQPVTVFNRYPRGFQIA